MRSPTLWIGVCLLATLLAGCATESPIRSGTARAVTSVQSLPPPDTTSASGVYSGAPEYRIGPLDLLDINVFQVPDLSQTVRVNSAGQISLPLIGTLKAGGLSPQELEELIAAQLSAKFLQNPQVTVFVKEYTSQRITIEGSVKRPGIFPLTGRTTLLQAIATAGGMDSLANLQGVVIFRQIGGKKMAAVFDFKQIRAGNVEDPQVYGDDIVVVEQSGSKTALRNFIQAIPVFNVFQPYGF